MEDFEVAHMDLLLVILRQKHKLEEILRW